VELMARVRRVARLLADPKTPRLPKLAVLLAAAYLLVPADALPELVFPIVGYLDDLVAVWLSLRWLLRSGSAPEVQRPAESEPTRR
jgi:uncharacterized membrane protein YkvA (DUF1232 family)